MRATLGGLLPIAAIACNSILGTEPAGDSGDRAASTDGGANDTARDDDGASSGDASDARHPPTSESDAGGDADARVLGPGPYGALPSGYCCTSDEQCRFRHCEDVNGSGKMCLDDCRNDDVCQRPDIAFRCDNGGSSVVPGFCKPQGTFACIPSAKFEGGTKLAGTCCAPASDGTSGLECMGGLCVSRDDGPFLCSAPCAQPKDCPSPFLCDTEIGWCTPASSSYLCK